MSSRSRHAPVRLRPNLSAVIEASGLSNGAVARALTALGRTTDPSTVSRWRHQVCAPLDLRTITDWSGVAERLLSYGTETQVAAAIGLARTRGLMAPLPDVGVSATG